MKKSIFIIPLICFSSFLFAQTYNFKQAEDSLIELRQKCLEAENDSIKMNFNTNFSTLLFQVLSKKNASEYPFSELKSIAIIASEDKSFRLFNWEISHADNTISYFALVQSFNSKGQLNLSRLIDKSIEIKKPENTKLDANNWYGAHYYKLIETKKKKKKYYTLLGANWSNTLVRKKIIDVITIGTDGKVKFGDAIFQTNKITSKRVIFHYAAEISMSLRYDENMHLILFDHLVPRASNLKGQYEFYGPDLSIDGYEFIKGKWIYKEDMDARNQKK